MENELIVDLGRYNQSWTNSATCTHMLHVGYALGQSNCKCQAHFDLKAGYLRLTFETAAGAVAFKMSCHFPIIDRDTYTTEVRKQEEQARRKAEREQNIRAYHDDALKFILNKSRSLRE